MKSNASEIYFSILAEIACDASNEEILESNPFHSYQDIEAIRNAPAYNPDYSDAAKRLCLLGLNNVAIAEYFSIPIYIFNCWRNVYPKFKKAIAHGRENADCAVAEALLSICIGYEHPEEKIITLSGGKGEGSYIERVQTVKHYPPNIAAIKLWLEARRSGIWKNPELIEIGMSLSIETKDMSKEALDSALAKAGLVKAESKLSDLPEIEDAEIVEEDE